VEITSLLWCNTCVGKVVRVDRVVEGMLGRVLVGRTVLVACTPQEGGVRGVRGGGCGSTPAATTSPAAEVNKLMLTL
jgi:hypothetical protein